MKISFDELKDALWGAATKLRGKINAGAYKEYIFPLVFFKRVSDVYQEERRKLLEATGDESFADLPENHTFMVPKGCGWDDVRAVTQDIGEALARAWNGIEKANPERVVDGGIREGLTGIFGKRAGWKNKKRMPDATISELIEHFSTLDLSLESCPADEMGNAYEYLVGRFADDAGNTAQEFYTNRTVVELMTEMLEPKARESIYDPTCGTGGMLISCIARLKDPAHPENNDWRTIRAFGQELKPLTSSIARMNLFLHGVEEFRVVNDDVLVNPRFLDAGALKTFDIVLANPPYSIKKWNRELFAGDTYGRNFLGTPPQGRADYAFIQHIFKSMDPVTGRCAILLPHGVLSRDEEQAIRRKLIDLDILECVIGLGPNLFFNASMEACIMVCRSKKPAERRGKVLFIDAKKEVVRKNSESRLTEENQARILKAYRDFASVEKFAYVATNDEIREKGCNIGIQMYVMADEPPVRERVDMGAAANAWAAGDKGVADGFAELVKMF